MLELKTLEIVHKYFITFLKKIYGYQSPQKLRNKKYIMIYMWAKYEVSRGMFGKKIEVGAAQVCRLGGHQDNSRKRWAKYFSRKL